MYRSEVPRMSILGFGATTISGLTSYKGNNTGSHPSDSKSIHR